MKYQKRPKCPLVDPKLVDHLATHYTESLTSIQPGMTEREVGMLVGQARVIDYLRGQVEAQTSNNLAE